MPAFLLQVACLLLTATSGLCGVGGGHYKIRAPPPPPVPPANIHYGPHPPPHRPHGSPSYIHPYRAPPPPPPPPKYQHHSPSIGSSYGGHYPRSPYYHKSTPREYHHRVPSTLYQPKLQAVAAASYAPAVAAAANYVPAMAAAASSPYNLWSNYAVNAFRAPLLKETFNSAPTPAFDYNAAAASSFLVPKDDDKGPIHTIPAPNLGGGPDAAHAHSVAVAGSVQHHQHHQHNQQHHHHHHHNKQDPEADLVAVLRHGITNVNVPHTPSYQESEDPSIHTPEKDTPLHFAPDPDPSTPSLKVPATNDPHSIPSNGQVPLDIYLQQEADKQLASTEAASNALTAQELFNLLNYQPSAASPQISSSSLSSFPVYNPSFSGSGAQFAPQFQTFNYDERTQQGAYGSNSFPTASMSLEQIGVGDFSSNDNLLDVKALDDNDLEGSEKDEVYHKIVDPDNEIEPKRAEPKKKSLEKKDPNFGKTEVTRPPKHPSSNDLPQQNNKFEIRVPQDVKDKIRNELHSDAPCPPGTSCVLPVSSQPPPSSDNPQNTHQTKPDDGVQLQKSIQIFATTYSTSVNEGYRHDDPSTPKSADVKKGRGIAISEILEENINPQSDSASVNLPFGARIRPKRF